MNLAPGVAGLSSATYGEPATPSAQVPAASISGEAFPAGNNTLQSQGQVASLVEVKQFLDQTASGKLCQLEINVAPWVGLILWLFAQIYSP